MRLAEKANISKAEYDILINSITDITLMVRYFWKQTYQKLDWNRSQSDFLNISNLKLLIKLVLKNKTNQSEWNDRSKHEDKLKM